MTHPNFTGLALPPGWEWSENPLPEPTIHWPEVVLTAVIAHESVVKRRGLFPRFQLFDERKGVFEPLVRTEDFAAFLAAFDGAVIAAKQRNAAEVAQAAE